MAEISIQPLVAAKTGLPRVENSIDGRPIQLEIQQAREIGLQILQAAESAVSDGFLLAFLQRHGMTDSGLKVLFAFREYREAQNG